MDMPVYEKAKTCFFAGHRPYRFTFLPAEQKDFYTKLESNIANTVRDALNDGFTTFLCGGTMGFDIMCSEAVLKLKEEFPEIRLGLVLPFENHHNEFDAQWKARYLKIMEECDFIDYVSPDAVIGCYYDRNKKMIDNSARMITYFDGKGGGTARVVAVAQTAKIQIINLFEAPVQPENITFFVGYDKY